VVGLRFQISIFLDGYTAGPQQSKENPLGIGGAWDGVLTRLRRAE
jgi:hypothetical protein